MSEAAKRPVRWGRWAAGVASAIWALLVAVTFRTCTHQHSRPVGHGDITLDVSPSGKKVVFNARGEGTWDLYVLNLETSHVDRIAATPAYELTPRFSPDEVEVVYAAAIAGDRADHIFVRSTRGGPARQLTNDTANDTEPLFSPDGTMIAFVRDTSYNWGGKGSNWSDSGAIWVMDRDGGNQRQVTPEHLHAHSLRFVDNATIEFNTLSGRFTASINGTEPPVSLASPLVRHEVSSPDGKLIAYVRGEYSGDQEIFVANRDGTDERQITNSTFGSFKPVFAPSGKQLYFLREQWPDGGFGTPVCSLWVVTLDDTPERMLQDWALFENPLAANTD